jgi:hypothetical protein
LSDLFDRLREAQAFAGSVVEFGGEPVEVGGAVDREVAALGEVLAQRRSQLLFKFRQGVEEV